MTIPTGSGVFVRKKDHIDLRAARAAGIHFLMVPVCYDAHPMNRGELWYAEARELGLEIHCWSWFTVDEARLIESIEFAANVGAESFSVNGEAELRDEERLAKSLATTTRRETDRHGLSMGFISFPALAGLVPFKPFAERCDFGVPEVYDREGAYAPEYPPKSIERWRNYDFKEVIAGCGAYYRPTHDAPWRWRSAEQLRNHLALFPPTPGRVAWGIGRWPVELLEVLGEGPPK